MEKQRRRDARGIVGKIAAVVFAAGFVLSIVPAIRALAEGTIFKIQSAEITEISTGASGGINTYDEQTIVSNVTFHKINDSISYKIVLQNSDSKDHIIESITDDNASETIDYIYDAHAGETVTAGANLDFLLTAKYATAVTDTSKRAEVSNVKFFIKFTDVEEPEEIDIVVPDTNEEETPEAPENPETPEVPVEPNTDEDIPAVPDTGKNTAESNGVSISLATMIISVIGLTILAIIAVKKHKKYAKIIGVAVVAVSAFGLATTAKAVNIETNSFTLTTNYGLYDKLVIKNGDKDVIINYGDKLEDAGEITNPEKPGYIFSGWQDEDGNDIDPTDPIYEDLTIKPKFTAISYKVRFNANGGAGEMADQTFTYDEAANLTANAFTYTGRAYAGWDTEANGSGVHYDDAQSVKNLTTVDNGVVNLYAQWSINPYYINYDANGGEGEMATTNCEYDEDCQLRANAFTKYGYDFAGWKYGDQTFTDGQIVRNLIEQGTITLEAQWTPTEYEIHYDGITDEERFALNNPTTYTIETPAFQLHNPADRKDNDGDTVQVFVGWQETTTYPIIVLPNTNNLGTKTYKAIWESYPFPRYAITYHLGGGNVATANPTTHDKTESFTLNEPTKTGYTFTGWTGTTIEGSTPVMNYTLPAPHIRDAIEFTAHYRRNTYTIVFDGNNATSGATASMSMTYDEAQNLTANGFARTGYIFAGWKYNNEDYADGAEVTNLTAEDGGAVTMVAQWEPTQYTIIFHANNENVENPDAMAAQIVTYDIETPLTANAYTWWQHKIVEWTTNENGTGTKYADKATIKNLDANGGEVHLYAKWREIDAALQAGGVGRSPTGTRINTLLAANPDAKRFVKYTAGIPSDEVLANAVDTSGTIDPIWLWVEGENLYWWSEDVKPRISSRLTSTDCLFNGAGTYTVDGVTKHLEYADLTGFDTSNITDYGRTFHSSGILEINISDWDFSHATNMSEFIAFGAVKKATFPEVVDARNVVNMNVALNFGMVTDELDLSGWKTRDVKNLSNFLSGMQAKKIKFSSDFKTDNVESMASMFSGNSRLTSIEGLEYFDTAKVKNMSNMFASVRSMESLDLSTFSTAALTNMNGMFSGMSSLTSLTLGGSFTANDVTDFTNTFKGLTKLQTIDLSNLTSTPTDMSSMFESSSGAKVIDISGMDLSAVTKFTYTFISCGNLETTYVSSNPNQEIIADDGHIFLYSGPKIVGGAGSNHLGSAAGTGNGGGSGQSVYARIDDPDNGNPGYFTIKGARYIRYHDNDGDDTNDEANYALMKSHYLKAGDSLTKNAFTRRGFKFAGWKDADGNEYTDEQVMAELVESKTPLELYAQWGEITATLNTGANVNNALRRIAGDATSFEMYTAGTPGFNTIDGEQIISANNSPAKVYAWQDAEAGKIYWWSEAYQPMFNANSASMFAGLTKLTNIDLTDLNASTATNLSSLYKGDTALVSTNITAQDTSNATNMNSMFMNTGFTELSLEGLETNNVTDMANMFNGVKKITTLDTTPLNTEKVTTMSAMFANTTALDSINLTDFDTSSATNMSSMFSASGISSINLTSFDTTNVTDISSMFKNTANLATVDLSPLEVQSVTTMASLFESSGITSIDVAPLATESVTDMSAMFKDTLGLTELNVAPLNTTNVTTMKDMFYGSYHLASLDVSMLDTANVQNMSGTFGILGRETVLKMYDTSETTKFTTSNVTDMSYMFMGDRELNQGLVNIDLSHIDTSKVTNMSGMFNRSRARSLDFSHFDTRKVTNMSQMFFIAPYLSRIDLSAFETPELKNVNQMFYYDGGTGASVIDMRNFDFSKANLANLAPYGPWGGKTYYMGKFDLSSTTANTEINLGSNGTQKIYVNTEYDPSIALERNIRVRAVANGMNGTVANNTTRTYAEYQRIDDPAHDAPGFFWIENPLVVNFDAQGGTASRTKYSYIPGTDYGTLPTAANGPEGKTFTGWYTAAEGGEKVEDNNAFISSDTHTLYAHWSVVDAHFKPRYNSFSNLGTTTAGVTNFAKAPTAPTEEFLNTSAVVISDETSPTPIYGWIDGANFYWWSEDSTPALNENSNYFFNLFRDLKTIDFTSLDFSQVKKMSGMFKQTQIESIDLSWLDTSNVTAMDSLFEDCGKLATANLGGSFANLNNVTDLSFMFSGAGLEVIDIESWGWHTDSLQNMNSMFGQSLTPSTIKRVILGENFDSSHVTDMNNLFKDADKLEYVDLEHLDTSSATQMQSMFFGVSLSELHLENFDTKNVESFGGMFSYAPNLTTIYVGENFVVGSNVHDTHIFKNSTKLVGGAGTTYDATPYSSNGDDMKYLRIDDPAHDNPGYLTSAN